MQSGSQGNGDGLASAINAYLENTILSPDGSVAVDSCLQILASFHVLATDVCLCSRLLGRNVAKPLLIANVL